MDIAATGTDASSPASLTNVGGVLFFAATQGATGRELWKSDGTAAGTVLVKDITPGPGGSSPQSLTNVNGTLFFRASDGVNGTELWKSDGTAAGTVLVRDIAPGAASSSPGFLVDVGGTLFFAANDGAIGVELWKSDGTAVGTVLVKDIAPGVLTSSPTNLVNVGGVVYFSATEIATGRELWRSDGTAAGTVLVKDINPGAGSASPEALASAGGSLYFAANDGTTGAEPWKTDGTAPGTYQLQDIVAGSGSSRPRGFAAVGALVLFFAEDGTGLVDLWRYDGKPWLVRTLGAGLVSPFAVVGTAAYFSADTSALYRTDGTDGGTTIVRSVPFGFRLGSPRAVGSAVYFDSSDTATGLELWRSDGPFSAYLVRDVRAGLPDSSPASLTDVAGTLFFSADDGVSSHELWKSDGTEAGSVLVKDINTDGISGAPGALTNLNGTLLFTAYDVPNGRELWRSDGTTDGTTLVRDIRYGSEDSGIQTLAAVGGTALFMANDGVIGSELWRSDATTFGTDLLKDLVPGAGGSKRIASSTTLGGALLFSFEDLTSELWKSDGTPAGTVMLKEIYPSSLAGRGPRRDDPSENPGSTPMNLTSIGAAAFFVATEPTTGRELWKTDGTAGGTVLVKDIRPGPTGAFANLAFSTGNLTNVNGTLFFVADDGVSGPELWKSNGTAAGTTLVRDIRPGTAGAFVLSVGGQPSGSHLTSVNGTLFFVADDGVHGPELWKSDGTAAGTVLVKDIVSGSGGATYSELAAHGTTLFLALSDGVTGAELWKSDGTAAGTLLVRDILPGGGSSDPQRLVSFDRGLYFSATDGVSGRELWSSDGTFTTRVDDIYAGPADSTPLGLTVIGDTLFFSADDGVHGRELWKLVGAPVPPVVSVPTSALVIGAANTIAGGHFTAGSVVKLYVATASGPVTYGPYAPTAWTPTALTFRIPVSVLPGNGFAAIQVVNTDTGFLESNAVGALLFGSAAAGIPTITSIRGVPLAPAELSIGVAHIDTLVGKGATVSIVGTGFVDPVVNVFTAGGNIGPLTPIGGWTPTQLQVVIPPSALTGPGNFQVVNRPSYRVSNAVSAVIGALPAITSVSAAGGRITVTGSGFCALTVINLYNLQGGGVVNLGGLAGGASKIPLTIVSETQFTFVRPAGAVAGPAFVEALNPPFIPFSSSGNDPDGAFTMPGPEPPVWTEAVPRGDGDGEEGPALKALATEEERAATGAEGGASGEREIVQWTHAVGAVVEGGTLRATGGRGDWASGARSTRALIERDGYVAWTVHEGEGDVAFGFGHADNDGSLADLDFAWRLDAETRELVISEGGTSRAAVGTYAAGDRLRVAVRNGQIEYRRNGALVWTSTRSPRYPLVVDASLRVPGAVLRGVRLVGRLGTLVEWTAVPGVTTASLEVSAAGGGRRAVGAADGLAGTGGGIRAGTGAGVRAGTGAGPYIGGSPGGCAVAADLRGAAGIGFGTNECDYCLVRVDDRTVQVRHAGVVRGTWAAPAGTRVRVEIGPDGVVRYWSGGTRLDEVPLPRNGEARSGAFPGDIRGWLAAPHAAIAGATIGR